MPNSVINPNAKRDKPAFNLELAMVNAWQTQAWWLWLLFPLTVIYGAVIAIRRKLYQTGWLTSYKAPVPVMIIGNITVGGSGKTPLIIELVTFLQQQGLKVGVISRGYGGDESLMPQIVTLQSLPKQVGDEPCLIVRETRAAVAVCPNRQQAIETLLTHYPDTQLIIADDGLQHYKLQRDLEWVVVDSDRGFGNKQLLPAGFLREPLSRLKQATVIYHQRFGQSGPSGALQPAATTTFKNAINRGGLTMQLKPAALKPLLDQQPELMATKKVYALSGIGYPQRFFNTLRELGYQVEPKPKPDHHNFSSEDLLSLADKPIIITSKDAVKIAPLVASQPKLQHLSIWVLPVRAYLSPNSYTTLIEQLKGLGFQF